FGAPKAVMLLASGRGMPVPMPRIRVRRLARGLPGVHDLLPAYRCVTGGGSGEGAGARRPTPSDVPGLGGDRELPGGFAWQEELSAVTPAGHVQVVGAHQPTVQAVTIDAGTVVGHRYTYRPSVAELGRVDTGGDGMVPRESAQLPQGVAMPLAQ